MARLSIGHAIIDTECVPPARSRDSDGDEGVTDFNRLMQRVYDASAYAYAFDNGGPPRLKQCFSGGTAG